MKIKEYTSRIFTMFSENPLHFFGSALVVAAVSVISLGVFAMPVFAGFLRMFETVEKGGRPDFNILFSRMDKVLSMFVLFVIIVSTAALGSIMLIIPGIMIAALWLYAPFFMEFEKLDVQEALKASARLVIAKNYFNHITLTVALLLLNAFGGYILVGWIITLPATAGYLYFIYMEYRGKDLKVLPGDQSDSASLT